MEKKELRDDEAINEIHVNYMNELPLYEDFMLIVQYAIENYGEGDVWIVEKFSLKMNKDDYTLNQMAEALLENTIQTFSDMYFIPTYMHKKLITSILDDVEDFAREELSQKFAEENK